MRIKPIRISKEEWERFLALQIKRREDWYAVFSVNRKEEIWPFVCFGVTPEKDREYVSLDEFPRLREIAGYFIESVKEKGGRLFFSREGVFFIEGETESSGVKPAQFIEWRPDDSLADCWQEAEAQRAAYRAKFATLFNFGDRRST